MENQLKYYIVTNKPDDYGSRKEELVFTTEELSDEYYDKREVPDEDVETLKKYFTFVGYEEEKGRNDEQRFYGN